MILFVNKQTKEIIGTVDGRYHEDSHLGMSISTDGVDPSDITQFIIGYTRNEKGELVGNNMHLWDKMTEFEDPKHPNQAVDSKLVTDEDGKVIDIVKKEEVG